jgi:hypothetical protein
MEDCMENRTYKEWVPILETKNRYRIIDDDGYRMLVADGRENDLLTELEAFQYMIYCTMVFDGGNNEDSK